MRQRLLLDTSAWIEYFLGSDLGKRVSSMIDDSPDVLIVLPNVVASEVISKSIRLGFSPLIVHPPLRKCVPPIETKEYYFEAGKKHAELRKIIPHFSLVDAIILTLAEKNKATIITKDTHLAGPNTILLK